MRSSSIVPSGSWGGEIGCNEHGVAIGDEAIFTNQRAEKDGVVVLDLLRLGLERATTAREAVDVIGAHVVEFGQGGNCQMMGNYCFDSGLLIADRQEAWIVNCAGHHWAARRGAGRRRRSPIASRSARTGICPH